MKFVTTVDRDEDGVWVVECPSIPGCVSQGNTKEEALANIREAIALCLEVRASGVVPLTRDSLRPFRSGTLCAGLAGTELAPA
jgi:predicted RNase H-like HicB family nuclease